MWLCRKDRFLIVSIGLLSISGYKIVQNRSLFTTSVNLRDVLHNWSEWLQIVLYLGIGVTLYDIYTRKPGDSASLKDIFLHYIRLKIINRIYGKSRQDLEKHTYDVKYFQNKLLREIFKAAAGSAYSKDFCLKENLSMEAYRKSHPLTDYNHYSKYINLILNGEQNVLFNAKLDYLCSTTGTTSGKSKLYPYNTALLMLCMRRGFGSTVVELYNLPGVSDLKRFVDISVEFTKRHTNNGIPIGPVSIMFPRNRNPANVTPLAGMQITHMRSSIYVQVLFALKVKDVGIISGMFTSHCLAFFTLMEEAWDELCFDIQMGQLNQKLELSPEIREQLNKELRPDRTRALELRREFRKGFQDIALRLWPDLAIISSIDTGSFQPYTDLLRRKYTGCVGIHTKWHGATEGLYGIDVTPFSKDTTYITLPYVTVYEFISLEDVDKENASTVLAHEVKIGHLYEMVVTTVMGLYRYRTNDVVKITRFYNQAPMYQFMCRLGDNLDLYGEKTPAFVLSSVVEQTFSRWSEVNLVDYTFTECVRVYNVTGNHNGGKMYYVLFIELFEEYPISQKLVAELDDALCQNQEEYHADRTANRIQPLRVIQVAKGTFNSLKELLLSSNPNASNNQLKVPRVLKSDDRIKCVLKGVIDQNSNL